jgi:hypothetical protein
VEEKMSIEVMRQALEVLEQINQLSVGENALALPGEIEFGERTNWQALVYMVDAKLKEKNG